MKRKLKAASLIEVVVALVIIMTVMALSVMIYIKIIGSTFNNKRLWANSKLQETAALIKMNRNYKNDIIHDDELIIEVTVSPYQSSDLLLIDLMAKDQNGSILGVYKEVILTDEKK